VRRGARSSCAVGVGGLALVGLLLAPQAALAQGAAAANAVIRDASGTTVGMALFSETTGGVRITLQAQGLPPGRHGIHLHAVGQCDAPAFTTAGGHFNPTNRLHGLNNPQGPHAGDLPELMVVANGSASYATTSMTASLSAGANSLLDADGSALVIHANPDDQVTDPTGNSGDRIACGALVRGAAALPATGGGPAGGAAAPGGMMAALLVIAGLGLRLGGWRPRRGRLAHAVVATRR
jgi:superoxide dismutase, Cu-Zn family